MHRFSLGSLLRAAALLLVAGVVAGSAATAARSAVPEATDSYVWLEGGAAISDGVTPAPGHIVARFVKGDESYDDSTTTATVDFTLPKGVTASNVEVLPEENGCAEPTKITVKANEVKFQIACDEGQGFVWEADVSSRLPEGSYDVAAVFKVESTKRAKSSTNMWQIQMPGAFVVAAAGSNSAPTAYSAERGGPMDSGIEVFLIGSDPDGDPLTFSIASGPSHGTLGAITPLECMEEGCLATVVYIPDSGWIGEDSFTYTANDGQTDSDAATISLTVNESPMSVDPVGLDFGETQIGPIAIGVEAITFTNHSSSTLYLGDSDLDSESFSISGSSLYGCQQGVDPGQSCTANIAFAPPEVGPHIAFFFTHWIDESGSLVADIATPLAGTGVVRVDQSPSELTFDHVTVDTTSAPQTVTFTNETGGTLFLSNSNVSTGFGADLGDCTQTSGIAAGQSCTVPVTFSPAAAGIYHGQVTTWWETAGGDTVAVLVTPLHATTPGLDFALTVAPSPLDFGAVTVGSSDKQSLTFTNDTTTTLEMTGLSRPQEFYASLFASDCGSDNGGIPPGGTCTVSVTFSPSEAITYTGSITTEWAAPESETILYNTSTPVTGTGISG